MAAVTIDRLSNAIMVTAYAMVRHDLPQLLSTLKRLEAARDNLSRDGDALDYAKRVLDGGAVLVGGTSHCKRLPSPPLADAA